MGEIEAKQLLGPWFDRNQVDLTRVPLTTLVYLDYDQAGAKVIRFQRRVPSPSGQGYKFGRHGEIELEWCEAPLLVEPSMELQSSGLLSNPPGSVTGQLPEEILALLSPRPYVSTACATAKDLEAVTGDIKRSDDEAALAEAWADRLHERCRLNHKFTGQLCACPHHIA